MTIQAAVYEFLKADADVSALVVERIYSEVADPGAQLPYVVVTTLSDVRERDLQGPVALSRTPPDRDWETAAWMVMF